MIIPALRRMFSTIALTCLLLVIALLAFQFFTESTAITSLAANLLIRHNFHEVVPGRLYRSGEMSHADLQEILQKNKIGTVVDLRLGNSHSVKEAELVSSLGLQYHHLRWRGSQMIPADNLAALLHIYDTAPEPILVHCTSGTHRSGVAAALWLLHKLPESERLASEQLALQYGYVGWERRLKTFFSGHRTVDNVVWDYFRLAQPRPAVLDWVQTKYVAQ